MRAEEVQSDITRVLVTEEQIQAKLEEIAAQVTADLTVSIEGRHVLLVEDIIDTGRTISYLRRNLETRRPESLRICTLLDKIERREVPVELDYVGFTIPNEFVVGYGLDYAGLYRNLPYLAALDLGDRPAG